MDDIAIPDGYLQFNIDSRLFDMIGRQSVSDPIIALLEVIKNSYDADSTKVTVQFSKMKTEEPSISIIDNGHGMTLDDIEHKWMRVATTNKIESPISPRGRRKIGEKGIGRFALQKLARKLTFYSETEGESLGYMVTIDWDEFEKKRVTADSIPNPYKIYKKDKSDSHGFRITLKGLREKWNAEMIKKVFSEIRILNLPLGNSDSFDVKVESPEFPKYEGRPRQTLLKNALYKFTTIHKESGETIYRFDHLKNKKIKPIVFKIFNKESQLSCGPFEMNFWFFYRDIQRYQFYGNTSLHPDEIKEIKEFLDDWGGIKLYRDKFRVKPFGDVGNDWLLLDKKRVQNPTLYPGNDQVYGFVKIGKDKNKGIVDITTREGILKEKPFNDMLGIIQQGIIVFSKSRQAIEEKRKIKEKKKTGQKSRTVPSKFILRPTVLSPKEITFDFDINKIPEDMRQGILMDIEDMKSCFKCGAYRGAIMFCGMILEYFLARKYYEKTNIDLLESNCEIGIIIRKCSEEKILNEPGLGNLVNLINETRKHSVHTKKSFFVPSERQTDSIIQLANSVIEKLI